MAYSPQNFTITNKSLGVAQAVPTDARSWFYDATLFKMRPYTSIAEVLAHLNTETKRKGHFSVFINSTGVLDNGDIIGGQVEEYWFRNGTASNNLVKKFDTSNEKVFTNGIKDTNGNVTLGDLTATVTVIGNNNDYDILDLNSMSISTKSSESLEKSSVDINKSNTWLYTENNLKRGEVNTYSDRVDIQHYDKSDSTFVSKVSVAESGITLDNEAGNLYIKRLSENATAYTLAYNPTTGKVSYGSYGGINIYNTNGTLSGDRTIYGDNKRLLIENASEIYLGANDLGYSEYAYLTLNRGYSEMISESINGMAFMHLSGTAAGQIQFEAHAGTQSTHFNIGSDKVTLKLASFEDDNAQLFIESLPSAVQTEVLGINPVTGEITRMTAPAGSGGGIYTSTNGLSLDAGAFGLGGTLSKDTVIVNGPYKFRIENTPGSTTDYIEYFYTSSNSGLQIQTKTGLHIIDSDGHWFESSEPDSYGDIRSQLYRMNNYGLRLEVEMPTNSTDYEYLSMDINPSITEIYMEDDAGHQRFQMDTDMIWIENITHGMSSGIDLFHSILSPITDSNVNLYITNDDWLHSVVMDSVGFKISNRGTAAETRKDAVLVNAYNAFVNLPLSVNTILENGAYSRLESGKNGAGEPNITLSTSYDDMYASLEVASNAGGSSINLFSGESTLSVNTTSIDLTVDNAPTQSIAKGLHILATADAATNGKVLIDSLAGGGNVVALADGTLAIGASGGASDGNGIYSGNGTIPTGTVATMTDYFRIDNEVVTFTMQNGSTPNIFMETYHESAATDGYTSIYMDASRIDLYVENTESTGRFNFDFSVNVRTDRVIIGQDGASWIFKDSGDITAEMMVEVTTPDKKALVWDSTTKQLGFSNISGGSNIGNSDLTLSGPRILSLNENPLTFMVSNATGSPYEGSYFTIDSKAAIDAGWWDSYNAQFRLYDVEFYYTTDNNFGEYTSNRMTAEFVTFYSQYDPPEGSPRVSASGFFETRASHEHTMMNLSSNGYHTGVKARADDILVGRTTVNDYNYKGIRVFGTGDLQFHNYPNTRNDGVLTKALGTDASGNVILGTLPSGGSYTFNGGLTNTSGTVKLGGTLNSNVILNGLETHNFIVLDANELQLSAVQMSLSSATTLEFTGATVAVTNLASLETGMVVADASGILGKQALPKSIYTDDGMLTGNRILNTDYWDLTIRTEDYSFVKFSHNDLRAEYSEIDSPNASVFNVTDSELYYTTDMTTADPTRITGSTFQIMSDWFRLECQNTIGKTRIFGETTQTQNNVSEPLLYAAVDYSTGSFGIYSKEKKVTIGKTSAAGYQDFTGISVLSTGTIVMDSIPVYADNTAATAALPVGGVYRTATGQLMIRY